MKIIIIGAGEVGFHVASRLALENKNVVVVDNDLAALNRIAENIDVQVFKGSGSSPLVLEMAGIHEAEILLAVTDSDETNLVACLVANLISPTTKKLARIRNADYDNYHEQFKELAPHIDTIINPETEVIKTIERLLSVPGAVDVGEFADGRIKLIGIRLEEKSHLAGVKLMDFPLVVPGVRPLIAAVIRNEELIVPRGHDVLIAGDIVYFISEGHTLQDALKAFGRESLQIKRAIIVGGGRIGIRLAKRLVKKSIHTKIIEQDLQRCNELAEQTQKVVVLHGDGADQTLLHEEGIRDTDVLVTLTGEEEINILASLLAKRMGAAHTITRISKFSYFPLMSTIGVEQVVSPRLSAIGTILQHIRRGKIISAMSINGEEAEVLEAEALETSAIVGKPLKKIAFPKGALIISIIHEDSVIIPSGDSVVWPNDRVIIFSKRTAIQKIEKFLTVKLEFF